jgi:MFS family permease
MSQVELQANAAHDGPAATRWAVVFVLFAAGIVAAGHIGMLPAALPAIRKEMAIDLVTAGWVLSIFSVTAVGFGMLAGGIADRLGHRRVILGSLLLLAFGAAAGASAPTAQWVLAARAFEGIGFVALVVSSPSLISQATRSSDRRLVFGLWGAYMPTGLGLMLLVAPALLAPFDWRGFWWIVAGATLSWAVVVWLVLRGFAPPAAPGPRDLRAWFGDLRQTLARPGLWCLAGSFMAYSLPWMALMAWLPSYLVEERGLAMTLAAHLTVIVVGINVLGNLTGGWLMQRGLPRWSLLGFSAALTAACGVGIFASDLSDGWRYGLCLLFSGLGGVLPAAAFSGVARFAPSPRHIGGANGMLVQGSAVGQLGGPPIIAMAVSAAGGWQGGAWIFAGCGLFGLGFALALRALERRL